DVSDRHLGFVLEGPAVAAILHSGCPLDLDPRAFPVGMATRSLFHKAEILLWRIAPMLFRIETGRSFAPYLVAQIGAGARDLG
ncbi:MAG: sarcosine oxidase subunit gamma, partial [Hyphomicrobiales bacterium]|nr:sarcosine oxidase subunit gamma [Hyphomicrobiales bacterium]